MTTMTRTHSVFQSNLQMQKFAEGIPSLSAKIELMFISNVIGWKQCDQMDRIVCSILGHLQQ